MKQLLKYWDTSFRPQTPVCFSWGCLTAKCGTGIMTRKTETSFSMRKQTRMFWILYYKIDLCGSEYGRQIFGCVNPQHYKIKLSGKKDCFFNLKKWKGVFFLFSTIIAPLLPTLVFGALGNKPNYYTGFPTGCIYYF